MLCIQDPLLKPNIARLRRRHLSPATRRGRPIRGLRRSLLLALWRQQQKATERQHLKMRLAMVEREASLQALYGKPYYLADQPPVRKAGAMV
jgi:hypothetical protein